MNKTNCPFRVCRANGEQAITELAALADRIWHECFATIISREQIDYMLERFQSPHAFSSQLQQGYAYYFIRRADTNVGYFGIREDPDGRLFLSKLYLSADCRGEGASSFAFGFMEDFCRRRGLKAIWLTVNRHNDRAIGVYLHRGFRVVEEKAADIGRGFVMDDFIMEKPIPASGLGHV